MDLIDKFVDCVRGGLWDCVDEVDDGRTPLRLDFAGLDEGGQGGEAVFVVNGEGHGILVEELEDGWDRICCGGVDDNLGGHLGL